LFRVIALERWIYDENLRVVKLYKLPTLLGYYILRKVKNMCYAHGIGRHSQEEVYHIMDQDLKAVSDYLGNVPLRVGVFLNAAFNNISVISLRSVLLVEETGENHRPAASH